MKKQKEVREIFCFLFSLSIQHQPCYEARQLCITVRGLAMAGFHKIKYEDMNSKINNETVHEAQPAIAQPHVIASAVLSDCGKYRYSLSRVWDDAKPRVLFIMLNPSTADAENDDPTIRRCIGFAKDWGYGGLHVVNLFARRATDPKELLTFSFVVGIDNIKYFKQMSALSEIAVCAWGNGSIVKKLQKRLDHTWKPLSWIDKPLHYLELSNDGTPKHPLYLPKNLKPVRYEVPKVSLS